MLKKNVKTVRSVTVDLSDLYCQIGAAMKQARETKKLTQAQVGLALGMTRANVSNLEAGTSAILLAHIYNLAMFLKVPVTTFLPKL